MSKKAGKFNFTVPSDAKTADGQPHPEAGQKQERAFEYDELGTQEEAEKYLSDKKLSLVKVVNDILKANARANAYQSAVIVYKPSEVSAEDIAERMVRDAIRMGLSEADARKFVAGIQANTGN